MGGLRAGVMRVDDAVAGHAPNALDDGVWWRQQRRPQVYWSRPLQPPPGTCRPADTHHSHWGLCWSLRWVKKSGSLFVCASAHFLHQGSRRGRGPRMRQAERESGGGNEVQAEPQGAPVAC